MAEAYQELHRADDRLIALMGSGGKSSGTPAAVGASGPTPSLHGPIVTLADLLAAQLPPVEFFIDQVLCIGVTSVSGRPKVGKSWLAEAMALALSTGGKILGFRARQVCVLYLATEDSPGRLQNRFQKMGAAPNDNLHVAFGWRALDAGGLEDLEAAVVQLRCQVVFIDTFSRVNGRADQMDPNEMTQIYAALQGLALRHNLAIVVVDHHRKTARNPVESDPIDDILGSTAKASVLDCAIGLYRKHNSTDAVLKLVGRDFGDAEYALTWDPEHFTWQRKDEPKPPAKESRPTSILDRVHVNEIVEAIDALGSCTLARLAAVVQIDKSNLFDLLKALVDAGVLRRNTDNHIVTYSLRARSPAPTAARRPMAVTAATATCQRTPRLPRTPRPRIPRIPLAPRTFPRRARPPGGTHGPPRRTAPAQSLQNPKNAKNADRAWRCLLHPAAPRTQQAAPRTDPPTVHQFKKGHHDHRLAGPHRPRHRAAPRRLHARRRTRRTVLALPPGRIPHDRHRSSARLAPPGPLGLSWPPRGPQRLRPPRRRHRLPPPP